MNKSAIEVLGEIANQSDEEVFEIGAGIWARRKARNALKDIVGQWRARNETIRNLQAANKALQTDNTVLRFQIKQLLDRAGRMEE